MAFAAVSSLSVLAILRTETVQKILTKLCQSTLCDHAHLFTMLLSTFPYHFI
jgi:hypothetical protein